VAGYWATGQPIVGQDAPDNVIEDASGASIARAFPEGLQAIIREISYAAGHVTPSPPLVRMESTPMA